MVIANLIAYIILIIGGLNWGLVGIFNFNLVSTIFGAYPAVGTIIVYVLVSKKKGAHDASQMARHRTLSYYSLL